MITLHLKTGGMLEVPVQNIISYKAVFKGSVVEYSSDGVTKTVEVYEAPCRIKTMLKENNHE